MENISNVSSEEELLQLRDEGKISEDEYRELLEALKKPGSEHAKPAQAPEPQFDALRVRLLTFSLVSCIIGLPTGLMLKLPYVWGLSILGLIVAPMKLSRIENSWLAKILNKQKRLG
jgi:hypothetical protein